MNGSKLKILHLLIVFVSSNVRDFLSSLNILTFSMRYECQRKICGYVLQETCQFNSLLLSFTDFYAFPELKRLIGFIWRSRLTSTSSPFCLAMTLTLLVGKMYISCYLSKLRRHCSATKSMKKTSFGDISGRLSGCNSNDNFLYFPWSRDFVSPIITCQSPHLICYKLLI